MIRFGSFFVILWVLPTIVANEPPPEYSSRHSPIDWSECDKQTNCYCWDGTKMLRTKTIIRKADENAELDGSKCNIGMQIKYFSENTAVFQLQVIGDKHELGKSSTLMIYQGTEELFGCKFDTISQKYEMVGDSHIRKTAKPVLFEKRTNFQAGNVICALKIKQIKKLTDWMVNNNDARKRRNAEAKMKLSTTTAEYPFEIDPSVPFLMKSGEFNCDPFSFKERALKTDETHHERFLENIDYPLLNCEEFGSSYTLRFVKGKDEGEIKELKCVPGSSEGFKFAMNEEKDGAVVLKEYVMDTEQYSFYCRAKFDEVCKKPVSDCAAPDKCPNYTKGEKGKAAQFRCPDKKYIIDSEYLELDEDPVCKQDFISNMNDAAFFTVFKGYEEKKPKARCFKEYNCKMKSNLFYPDCPDEDKCEIDYRNGIMKCREHNRDLSIYINNKFLTKKEYKCNTTDGRWIDDKGASLPDNVQVTCPEPQEQQAAIINMSFKEIAISVVIVFAVCAVIALLISLGVYCYYFKPKRFQTDGKKDWKKKSKAERIAYCKDLFGKVSQSTVDTPYRVVHGFNLLELLLDTETVEPKLWEEVYPFLMRFQGAIEKLDVNIKRMFLRYMYLQAKRIIEKHGWLSEHPITARTKKRKGLMRAIACRLLAFGIADSFSDDAELFIHSGFRKLGFKAVEQYPHCGILWNIMFHTRVLGDFKNVTDPTVIRLFDREKFTQVIEEIAFKSTIEMDDDKDVIPEYGSPAEQAAFALGGSPILTFLREKKFLENCEGVKGSVCLQYFAGMCASLGRNPSTPIITTFKAKDNKPETFLNTLQTIANESEWNSIVEKTMKLMVYYGRPFDAKRLQSQFMPSVNQPSELYSQTKIDQQFFVEAVDNQLGELRSWFADRTDKNQLKKAPVYKKDAAIDAVILDKLKKDKEKAANEKAAKEKAAEEEKSARAAPATAAAPEQAAASDPAAAGEVAPTAAPNASAPAAAPAQPNTAAAPAAAVPPPVAAAAPSPPPVAPAAPSPPPVAPAAPPAPASPQQKL